MKPVDFNIHLPSSPDQDHDFNILDYGWKKRFEILETTIGTKLAGGNISFLDSRILEDDRWEGLNQFKFSSKPFSLTVLIDPSSENKKKHIQRASEVGVKGIKLHPYHQDLTPNTYPKLLEVGRLAQENDLWIAVCCSYGTSKLYDIYPVEIVARLARTINSPVIALHGGGKLVLDVMSIALDEENVFLETSFSLSFWKDSSVEKDFAFAMKKIGTNRCLYGSDHPYIPSDDSLTNAQDFLDRWNFSDEDKKKYFNETARSIGVLTS